MLFKRFTAKDEEKTLCNKFKGCIGIEEALYHESGVGHEYGHGVLYFSSKSTALAANQELSHAGWQFGWASANVDCPGGCSINLTYTFQEECWVKTDFRLLGKGYCRSLTEKDKSAVTPTIYHWFSTGLAQTATWCEKFEHCTAVSPRGDAGASFLWFDSLAAAQAAYKVTTHTPLSPITPSSTHHSSPHPLILHPLTLSSPQEMAPFGYILEGSHNCKPGCEITHVVNPKCLVKTAPSGSRNECVNGGD